MEIRIIPPEPEGTVTEQLIRRMHQDARRTVEALTRANRGATDRIRRMAQRRSGHARTTIHRFRR